VFAASGTGAMEASFVNFLRKGDTAVVVDGGKFGERWGKLAKAYGVNAVTLKCEWGHPVEPAVVEKALRENPQAKGVYVQANESSTGVYHPIRELAQVTARTGAVLGGRRHQRARGDDVADDDWASTCCSAPATRRSVFRRGSPFSPPARRHGS